jgi:hypothetical protein
MIPGQKYKAATPSGGITVAAANNDMLQIAPANNVPLLLHRIVITANQLSAQTIGLLLLHRTTASTVGTALTPTNDSPAGPAASASVTYNLSTSTGTAGAIIDSQIWEEFAPYEFNNYPDGVIIVPGTWCCLLLLNNGNPTFGAAFSVEFTEIK